MRTLEQKISDAGPYDQRVDPHILTEARRNLADAGQLSFYDDHPTTGRWYYLRETPELKWQHRLDKLRPIAHRIQTGNRGKLIGQALEIAVYKSLKQAHAEHHLHFLGGFPELDDDDSRLFQKEEPQMVNGRSLPGRQALDFYVIHPTAGVAGIEVKNIREWIYPESEEIRETVSKCCVLDAVPVVICRRYSYSTYSVLHKCGVLLFQNYNQLYPVSETELADKARHKRLLGYHDIRVGNTPSSRLLAFIGENLPRILPAARERFDQYRDLLSDFADENKSYKSFAGRARRRSDGVDEDYGDED